ncbi:PREDICTED: probable serine/threonine-protein kinase kinX [Trachymyrmex septentrionalis]|uniref:probable serine/threonine-protein kinase kinX n=1 Tax=Trachymyrmex septentrionalis TaxID=34720 RepID=UPI00084EF1F1|nr:PREDICTED: probable serine/threonine-protein kinase kinX [Trachymyrmex septentrionalis]
MDNEIVLEKQLKSIIEPLKQIAGNTERGGKPFETKFMENKQKNKRKHSDDEDDDDDDDDNDDDDNDAIPTQITPQHLPWNKQIKKKRSNVMLDSSIIHSTPIKSQQQQQQQ